MSFLYPLGLLGLLGIPVLIAIYIIKSKYTEQTVSSTYLWRISERFIKRKNPISHVTGIISLILQLLAVTLLSLAIAHPIITVPGTAKEYCFVLDASGSMNMDAGGISRFEKGKEKIEETVRDAVNGSKFSLIYVGNRTGMAFERLDNKKQALALIEELRPSYAASDFQKAIGIAQGYFNENPSVLTYLVTDQYYQSHPNIQLINVATDVENYAVTDMNYHMEKGVLSVDGTVISYKSNATLTLELYLDGAETPSAEGVFAVAAANSTAFQLTCKADHFSSIRVKIAQTDALPEDNELTVFEAKGENTYDTLLVSDRPFFFRTVLSSMINAKIDVVDPKDYQGQTGYGLYIFDSFTPDKLPQDGAIWLSNPDKSVEGSGFSVQGEVLLREADTLTLSDSTATAVKKLTEGLTGDAVHISSYVKCGLYRSFHTVYSYQGNPVLFAGENANGSREAVFAFDLHNSNLPMLFDYVAVIRNLLEYSFPEIIEKDMYRCGEEVEINVIANCTGIRVDTPLGNVTYLDAESATGRLLLEEVGVYTVTMTVANSQKVFQIYSAMLEEEGVPNVAAAEIGLVGTAGEGGFDGQFDTLTVLFIVLALIFLADWVVYCYEKYQLR